MSDGSDRRLNVPTAISHVLRNCLFQGNAFNKGLSERDKRFVKLTAKLLRDGFQIWEIIEALARWWWLHNVGGCIIQFWIIPLLI